MEETTIFIKDLNCDRDLARLQAALARQGIQAARLLPGKVVFPPDLKDISQEELVAAIERSGFEILQDREAQIVVDIQLAVRDLVHKTETGEFRGKTSEFIARALGYSYAYLSRLYSRREGHPIGRQVILLKINRTKALLEIGEASLNEIAFQLGYNSVQYLSAQFRNVTGTTISDYRKTMLNRQNPGATAPDKIP